MSSDDHRTHLVIHFDINETILVEDEAGGDSREDCLNKMLAKSAFVQIPRESAASLEDIALVNEDTSNVVPTHWWDGTLIQEEYDKGLAVPPLYTGWQWPAGCCPYYRTAFKTRSKTFVSHHGTIYKPIYEKIHDKLSPGCFKSTDCILSHIIPAFFETLIELSPNKQTTIVLRTFGTDLPDVGAAISEFARGRHPDYPNFFDESLELHWDSFVKGRWSRVNDAVVDSNNNNFVYQLWNANETHVVASGDEAVLDFLHSRRICGIQDDYSHWDSNDCEPWAGKPVWITADPKYHHVLLDDNMYVFCVCVCVRGSHLLYIAIPMGAMLTSQRTKKGKLLTCTLAILLVIR